MDGILQCCPASSTSRQHKVHGQQSNLCAAERLPPPPQSPSSRDLPPRQKRLGDDAASLERDLYRRHHADQTVIGTVDKFILQFRDVSKHHYELTMISGQNLPRAKAPTPHVRRNELEELPPSTPHIATPDTRQRWTAGTPGLTYSRWVRCDLAGNTSKLSLPSDRLLAPLTSSLLLSSVVFSHEYSCTCVALSQSFGVPCSSITNL